MEITAKASTYSRLGWILWTRSVFNSRTLNCSLAWARAEVVLPTGVGEQSGADCRLSAGSATPSAELGAADDAFALFATDESHHIAHMKPPYVRFKHSIAYLGRCPAQAATAARTACPPGL